MALGNEVRTSANLRKMGDIEERMLADIGPTARDRRTLARPRLLPDAGDPVSRPRITVAAAPAGYGKTVLIDQWDAWAAARELPRIHVHNADDLIAAESAAGLGKDVMVLIDDIQAAKQPIRSLAQRYLESPPPQLYMIIAGRSVSGIRAARASLSRSVRVVGPDELRFTPDETRDWFKAQGIVSDPAIRSHLNRLANGWPAAIAFASALINDPNISAANLLSRLCRSGTAFAQYVDEEILAPLDPEIAAAMVETAPLRSFHATIGMAIVPKLQSRLPQMIEQGLITEQQFGGVTMFAHRPLVAELLEQRLSCNDPDRLSQIHQEAMNLYVAAEQWIEALPHAFAAGQLDAAIHILDQASARHQRIGRWRDFTSWIQRLEPALVMRYPQVAVEAACAHAVLFEAAKAQHYIDNLNKRLPELDQAVRNNLLVAEALVATFSDRPKDARAAGLRGLAELSGVDSYSIGTLRAAEALGLIAQGELEQARAALQLARAAHEEGGSPFGLSVVHALTGLTYAKQGDADTALLIWKQGDDAARQIPGPGLVSAVVLGYSAELHYDRDDLDVAEQIIEQCFESSIEVALPDTVRSLYLTRARIAFSQGRFHDATFVLEEAAATAIRRGWPQLQNAVAWERVQFAIRAGEDAIASDLASAVPEGDIDWEADNLGRLRIRALTDPSRDAIRTIHGAFLRAASQNLAVTAMRLRTVEAMAREASGDRLGALRVLRLAASAAVAGGFSRVIRDAGPMADALMRQLMAEAASGDQNYETLLRLPQPTRPQDPEEPLLEPLSNRETDIVRGIAEGLTNAEIGRRLLLTENTVKWHLQHVFAKLGAGNRTRALVIAKQHGIVG